MNILLLTAHSIAEHDDLRMLHELGHQVFSIGAYTNPSHPTDDKRPPLLQVPYHADLAALVEGNQMAHKAHLPDGIIDWADAIIAHHFVYDWIGGQWGRIRHKRVIWRTCGQTSPQLEQFMGFLRPEGLQIVRYSPKEVNNGPWFAGQDAMIRFGKEPSEWYGWTGEDAVVGNITQDMVGRADACGLAFWQAATNGLQTRPAGPMSELIGGVGNIPYDEMRAYLRRIRTYLYTGTRPAPYTLGLIEAMMTGVPVVSIGAKAWGEGWGGEGLFEGDAISGRIAHDTAESARADLEWMLDGGQATTYFGSLARQRAIEVFGMDTVKAQWAAFLG